MKSVVLSSVFALVTLFSVSTAIAQRPHVQSPFTSSINQDGQLVVCYDIAGLGNASQVPATLTFDAVVTTLCYNRGNEDQPVPGQTKTNRNVQIPFFVAVTNGRARNCYTTNYNPTCGSCPNGFGRSECTTTFSNIRFTIGGRTFNVPNPQ
jgi:hypothetical protein